MPIALLLQETVYTMRWGAFHLEPWTHLVRIEELLIDRARGAFLTHWFGPALPLRGSCVRVVIDNLAELRDRYLLASKSRARAESGPDLTEPIAGMAGVITGIALSPTGSILAIAVMVRDLGYYVKMLRKALGWKAIAVPLEPFLGPVVGPLVLPALITEKLADYRPILGPVARLLLAAGAFIRLLLGPRDKIKNPLLLLMLEFFDQLAGLVPFMLAFVAFVVIELGPLIEPLARQIGPFQALIDEVVATVSDTFANLPDAYHRFLPLVEDRIDFVMVQLENVFPVFSIAFTELFTNLSAILTPLRKQGEQTIRDWHTEADKKSREIIKSQPLMRHFAFAKEAFEIFRNAKAKAKASSGPEEPPGWFARNVTDPATGAIKSKAQAFIHDFPKPDLMSPEDYLAAIGRQPPGLDAIDILAKIDIRHGGALFGAYPMMSDDARTGLRALRPSHVFDTEQATLVRELGGKQPGEALAAARDEQMPLRDLLSAVIGRVLPPELRAQMGRVQDFLSQLDESLYHIKAAKAPFPVRDLPDNGKLRPIVHRLVIRGIDMVRADADTFQQRLQAAMNDLDYPAKAPAAALAGG